MFDSGVQDKTLFCLSKWLFLSDLHFVMCWQVTGRLMIRHVCKQMFSKAKSQPKPRLRQNSVNALEIHEETKTQGEKSGCGSAQVLRKGTLDVQVVGKGGGEEGRED